MQELVEKKKRIDEQIHHLQRTFKQVDGKNSSLSQLLCRPEYTYIALLNTYPETVLDHGEDINFQIELQLKYEGYIKRQENEAAKLENLDRILVPKEFDFLQIKGLSNEAREKLNRVRPINLGQASRMSGITPADISILLVVLRSKQG